MKSIHEAYAVPFTTDVDLPEEPPTMLHVVTKEGSNIVALRRTNPEDMASVGEIISVAYFWDGTHRVTVSKDIRQNETIELAHNQFKAMVVQMLESIGTRLNIVVPMLQKQELNQVEMDMGMGTLVAQWFMSENNLGVEMPIVTLSLSGEEVIRWASQQYEEDTEVPLIDLGILESHDQWRNYNDFDFRQLWGEIIK
jgi:hypothetical protein